MMVGSGEPPVDFGFGIRFGWRRGRGLITAAASKEAGLLGLEFLTGQVCAAVGSTSRFAATAAFGRLARGSRRSWMRHGGRNGWRRLWQLAYSSPALESFHLLHAQVDIRLALLSRFGNPL